MINKARAEHVEEKFGRKIENLFMLSISIIKNLAM